MKADRPTVVVDSVKVGWVMPFWTCLRKSHYLPTVTCGYILRSPSLHMLLDTTPTARRWTHLFMYI